MAQTLRLFLIPSFFLLLSLPLNANPLQEFIQAKMNESPELVQAREVVRASEAATDLVRARLYPTFSANWNSAKTSSSNGFQDLLSLNADQTLFGGGSEYTEIKAANLVHDRALHDLADTRDRLSANFAMKLTRLLVQRERLEVLRKGKRVQEGRLAELRRRFRLGQSREPDLLQVEVESSRLDRRIADTETTIELYEQQLQTLLLLNESELASLQQLSSPEALRLLIVGLKNRPDYRTASLRLLGQSLAQKERSAWLSAVPTLGLYGQKNIVRPSTTSNEWEWGVQAKWTFFEGFRTPAQVETVQAQRIVAEKQLFAFEHNKQSNLVRLQKESGRADSKKISIEADLKRARKALQQQEKDYRLSIVTELEVQQTLQSILDLDIELLEIQETRAQLRLQEFLGGESVL